MNAVAAELEHVRKRRGGGLLSNSETAGSRDEAGRKPVGDARLVSRRRPAHASVVQWAKSLSIEY